MTDHLIVFAFVTGLIYGMINENKKIMNYFTLAGFLSGVFMFCVRLYDPKGMNLFLMRFNRWLIAVIFVSSLLALLVLIITGDGKKLLFTFSSGILIFLALTSLTPPALQFTREFVYFGEEGVSTNALLRALGFSLGLFTSFLISLCACEVVKALNNFIQKKIFMLAGLIIFACEYFCSALGALNRLRIIPTSDLVFNIMIWHSNNPNAFIFIQLFIALIMLIFVIVTHKKPVGEFANKALLRKEKARLRDCRRWSKALFFFGAVVIFIVVVLHYYDTKPPAEVQPEEYAIENNIISVPLDQVSDGHLHKFDYKTPNGYDVRFLIVKKPAGNAYGVGLDACEICGIAGYFERGDEVVCRRCDVVMNKNTIGFKGGCNPIPFDYKVENRIIFIDVKELIKHELRFK